MDTALELRMAYDSRNIISNEQAEILLNSSDLVRKLITTFKRKPLYAIWRIIALSEIPYAQTLDGYWKINYAYKADGYLPFDKRGQKAEWLTYLLGRLGL